MVFAGGPIHIFGKFWTKDALPMTRETIEGPVPKREKREQISSEGYHFSLARIEVLWRSFSPNPLGKVEAGERAGKECSRL